MTLPGAKQKLLENRATVSKTGTVVERLRRVRDELMQLKTEFDELERSITFQPA
jgi:hypothetical protein